MNLDHINLALSIIHNDDALTPARELLAVWDPNEPDCYDSLNVTAAVFVTLTAFVNDPGTIPARALTWALEAYYELT